MRLFEFGAPWSGRSRLLSHTNATEKKAIRCSVKTTGGVVLLTYRPPKGKWSDYVQTAGNILLFSNWVASITSIIHSITSSFPSSYYRCFLYIHYFIFIFHGFTTNHWTKSDQPPWLICKLNSGLDFARCTGHGIAEVQGFEVVLAWILRLRCKGSFLLLWCSAFNFLWTLSYSSICSYIHCLLITVSNPFWQIKKTFSLINFNSFQKITDVMIRLFLFS